MPSRSTCRIESVLDCISDVWTLNIIHELTVGPRRTVELHGSFKGMSTKTLTERLKKLKRDGIVARTPYPESPPRVEYSLTEKGRELLPILRAIAEVASKWDCKAEAAPDSPPCRACDIVFGRMSDEEHSRTPPKMRKRTDVTLL